MGGADRFNLELVEWLTGGGVEVSIATTINGDHSWMPEFARFTPDIFPLHHFLQIRDFPRFLRYLIHSRRIDTVLISHSELGYLLLPYLRHHCPGVTFMDYCHIVEEYWRSGGYPRMSLEYQDLLDLNVVASKQVQDWMVQRGADRSRIEVCYIGVDARKWRPDQDIRSRTREELAIPEERQVVLFTGRLVKQKRPDILVESLALLGRRGNSFTALIAGDGPEMASVRSSIKLHGLEENVCLLGGLRPRRVRELLQSADVFFLPSQWEGIALSIYEAMACAVPVVGADVGGQRELVTPSCGVLLPRQGDRAREVEAYAIELERLLTNQEIRSAMGAASRVRVERDFGIEQTAQRMFSLVGLAQRLHREKPRPRPMPGLARTCAFQAIELVRLAHVADELWAKRNPRTWRARAYSRITGIFEPLYQWGVRRGWKWLVVARNRLRLAVLGRS
jgi:glycosyltransferase involved in cell wall biosynthesis